MKEGFTIPVEINITSHSRHQQFTVLSTITIIPKRPGGQNPYNWRRVGGRIKETKISAQKVKMSLRQQSL